MSPKGFLDILGINPFTLYHSIGIQQKEDEFVQFRQEFEEMYKLIFERLNPPE